MYMDAAAESERNPVISTRFSLSVDNEQDDAGQDRQTYLARQTFGHEQGQKNNCPCSADHEQDWQPYTVDRYSAMCDDYTWPPILSQHTYVIHHTNIISGCGKREAHINWSMVTSKIAAPVTGTTTCLRTTGPLSADSRH